MAGRVTHKQDWAGKECGWVPLTNSERPKSEEELGRKLTAGEIASLVTLEDEVRIGLESAIGRKLTAGEIAEIEKRIAWIKVIKNAPKPTSQDVIRSLANIGKLPPEEALAAYRKSDGNTQAKIDEVMLSGGKNIAEAAALANYEEGRKDRRPVLLYRFHLASYALSLWAQLGGGDCKVWARGGDAPPIVWFMAYLAQIADGVPLDLTTAVTLLEDPIVAKNSMR